MRNLSSRLLVVPFTTLIAIHLSFGIGMDHRCWTADHDVSFLSSTYTEQALASPAIVEEYRPGVGAGISQTIRKIVGKGYLLGKRRSNFERLITIGAHALWRYPRLTIKSVLVAAGIIRWRHTEPHLSHYRPVSAELADLFGSLNHSIEASGQFILPHSRSWNDYLVFAHQFSLKLARVLSPRGEKGFSMRLRYGVVHSVYNALIYGVPESPILLTWFIEDAFLRIEITNVALPKNIPSQHVEVGGIPISGMGGAIQTMRSLFDHVQLRRQDSPDGMTPKTVLSLAHRLDGSGRALSRWKRRLITQLASAKDNLQLLNMVTANRSGTVLHRGA